MRTPKSSAISENMTFEEKESWAENANIDLAMERCRVRWSWDCGKLDFDGPVFDISSRFYPPHNGVSPWEGKMSVRGLEKAVYEREFKCESLEELKAQVEAHVKELQDRIAPAILSALAGV